MAMVSQSAAIRFIEAFPEAQAFSVTILTEEKRSVVGHPQCPREKLLRELPRWLDLQAVHFYVRPLIGNLVMVDLDEFRGDFDILLKLQPRALVCTLPGNYQMWLTVPPQLASKCAVWVTKELTEVFEADRRSAANPSQQGRLPGSINVKGGKTCVVNLLDVGVQNMNEQLFLDITAKRKLRLDPAGQLQVQVQKAKTKPLGGDASAKDWGMCCAFFEQFPEASVAEALEQLKGKFSAQRGAHQAYYENLTATNASKKKRCSWHQLYHACPRF